MRCQKIIAWYSRRNVMGYVNIDVITKKISILSSEREFIIYKQKMIGIITFIMLQY